MELPSEIWEMILILARQPILMLVCHQFHDIIAACGLAKLLHPMWNTKTILGETVLERFISMDKKSCARIILRDKLTIRLVHMMNLSIFDDHVNFSGILIKPTSCALIEARNSDWYYFKYVNHILLNIVVTHADAFTSCSLIYGDTIIEFSKSVTRNNSMVCKRYHKNYLQASKYCNCATFNEGILCLKNVTIVDIIKDHLPIIPGHPIIDAIKDHLPIIPSHKK
jgi:hypothetical protein